MAYAYGNTIKSKWRAYVEYTVITNDATTYAIQCTVGIEVLSSNYRSYNASASLSTPGKTTYTGTSSNIGGSNTKHPLIKNKTYTWSKTHSTQAPVITFTFKTSGGQVAPGTSTGTITMQPPSGSTPIQPKTNYTVAYNANGGSGAPGAATKWYGETLTISSTIPTKTGHTFVNWKATNGTTYNPGAAYTANSGTTLTAQWKANTYQVTYNANGGTGSIASQTKTYGVDLTLSNGDGFTKDLHSLTGWNTAADGSGTAYDPGDTYQGNAAVTLYAQWHLDYIKPVISSFQCARTDNNGDPDDEGTYIDVSFHYRGGTIDGGLNYIPPNIEIYINGSKVYDAVEASGEDDFTHSPFGGSYSENNSHTVVVKVFDSNLPEGTTVTAEIPTATFPLDIMGDGTAMGVMMPAVPGKTLSLPANTWIGGKNLVLGFVTGGTGASSITFTDSNCIGKSSIVCTAMDVDCLILSASFVNKSGTQSTDGEITIKFDRQLTADTRINYIAY